jgi:hypothetical protein
MTIPSSPRTKVAQGEDLSFVVDGLEPTFWADAEAAVGLRQFEADIAATEHDQVRKLRLSINRNLYPT